MLNGIGGRTVAEAKERLTHHEFVQWVAFARQYGTLHPGLRLEATVGVLNWQVAQAIGRDLPLRVFQPHLHSTPVVADEEEDTVENLSRLMKGARRNG